MIVEAPKKLHIDYDLLIMKDNGKFSQPVISSQNDDKNFVKKSLLECKKMA